MMPDIYHAKNMPSQLVRKSIYTRLHLEIYYILAYESYGILKRSHVM